MTTSEPPADQPPAHRPGLRRDALRNRALILEHARRLFAETGLAAGHDQIAAAAGVGVGTVYRRFPRKEDLLAALFDERLDHVVALATQARAATDPLAGLTGFLEAMLALQVRDRGLGEMLLGSSRALELSRHAQERIAPIVAELLARAQESGQVRTDVRVQDVALVPLMMSAVIDSSRAVDPDLWRRTLTLVLDGFRIGAPPTPLPVPAPSPDQFERVLTGWRPPGR